jgi:hypothetical protein
MRSGSVFVLDAQAQPLMPVTEADARQLLASGTARAWSHPTLTVIQLTHEIEQLPVMRPVLIGIAIHRQAVELFVLAEGAPTTLPLLYVIVDVSADQQRQHGPHRRRRAGGQEVKLVLEIGAVIGALWRFLPLSHIVILPTRTLKHNHPGLTRRLQQHLQCDGLRVAIASAGGPVPDSIPSILYGLLLDLVK